MTSAMIESDHPIIFVYDVENRQMNVPEHVDGQLVDANQSCVAVGTRYHASGPTEVILAHQIDRAQGQLVFEGRIQAPSGRLSVNSSERERWCEIDVAGSHGNVRIWVNDLNEPSVITIEAH